MNRFDDDAVSGPGIRGSGATLEQAIDFVNTTGLSRGRPFEDLASAGLAVHWLGHAGVLDPMDAAAEAARVEASPATAAAALERIRSTRAGLREVIDAIDEGRAPSAEAIDAVNAVLDVPEVTQLETVDGSLRVSRRTVADPLNRALAALARALADEIAGGHAGRLRICQNDRCRWAFYDRSRPGTRRWCEMASCGNRMKAARHRARQRQAEADTPST